jgi:alanyl-tRNA synthetase
MDSNTLRKTFTQYFVDHGHTYVPSAGLIPHHPLAPLFTNAGMNQFLPYFLGEEAAPYPRATSSQKCVRIRGKHDDIEIIGRSKRHLTFFEMLGNFSFGDYFKEGAIKFHWELFTEVIGLEADRLWITVHTDDDVAAEIWHDAIGVPADRIQRMGEDNFWEMGDTGPCGPCSEIYYDTGEQNGAGGGPLYGDEERFREIGNLVFMEFDRQPGGALVPLPKQNIDTGSGLERIVPILQKTDSVWDLDTIRPIIERAEQLSGKIYGKDEDLDISMRIMADHARCMTFLVSDGVVPSNTDSGYVLRRVVRRMLRHAWRTGANENIATTMVDAVCSTMGDAYSDIVKNSEFIKEILDREEGLFRQTRKAGETMLLNAVAGADRVPGDVAFKLHDTYGFPIELTREIALEQGKEVDVAGFEKAMDAARELSRANVKKIKNDSAAIETYREIIDANGPTERLAYTSEDHEAKVVAVVEIGEGSEALLEVFLDRTPFYAERGGQVGDTGHLTSDTGTAEVIDTTYAVPELVRHTVRISEGRFDVGQTVRAVVDHDRRAAIRRNHTGTHILHWALRKVLGEQSGQKGSLVAPDRLRFDFNYHTALTPEQIADIENLANAEILTSTPVEAIETTYEDAIGRGAIAFFDEKYGTKVRMIQAGPNSLELCGGTHTKNLGQIGPLKIISESSIGSNLRRIEALTGFGALQYINGQEKTLTSVARSFKAKPSEVNEAVERILNRQKDLEGELKSLRAIARQQKARTLIESADNHAVVARVDGTPSNELRELALALRDHPEVNAAVLIGSPDGAGVALVAATKPGSGIRAGELIAAAAKLVGGGGGKGDDLAMAGGRNVAGIDAALEAARTSAQAAASAG